VDRRDVLEVLHQIAFSDQEEAHRAEEYIDLVLDSEEVPQEVYQFLFSLSDYAKDFFMRMESKIFYKNFKKFDKIEDIEKAKAISSFITHSLIEIEHGNVDLDKLKDDLRLNDFLAYLGFYLETGKLPATCIDLVEIIINEIDQLQEVNLKQGGDVDK